MSAAAQYRALAQRYRHLPEVVVRAGAAEIQRSLLLPLDRDTGGDRVLSGASKRRRTRLGVTVQVISHSAAADAEVKPSRRGTAQWSWLEYGTKERIVDGLIALARTGLDGVLLCWPRYQQGMREFRDVTYPLVRQAGLRDFS